MEKRGNLKRTLELSVLFFFTSSLVYNTNDLNLYSNRLESWNETKS